MLQYVKRVQNSATILVKMRLAFPPVLLYHKNNERERKQHPDILKKENQYEKNISIDLGSCNDLEPGCLRQ